MLEAKIVEVTLTNEAQSGVNWSLFRSYSSGGKRYGGSIVAPGVTLNQGSGALSSTDVSITPGSVVAGATGGAGFYGLALQAGNFAALLNFLQSQGDVQVLSSPRIATLNNQKAVLKVGTDAYYPISLGSSSTTNSATAGNSTTVNAPQVDTMFSGIVLDVTPRIDASGAILLHVHPIISSIVLETIQYSVGSTTGSGDLPKISVSETDSIVRVQDRQIVAIGGLMTQQVSKNKSGVTGLSDLPLIGGLFRQKATSTTKRELVVLIKPTLIGDDGEGFERDEPKTAAE
jgi:MSHA biogenesis protein MshL